MEKPNRELVLFLDVCAFILFCVLVATMLELLWRLF